MMIVATDYGNVRLSDKSLKWLESYDKNWLVTLTDKKANGKKAKMLREKVKLLETAANIAAEIEWSNGGELTKF